MNWFTRRPIEHLSDKEKRELLEQDGGCKHSRRNIKRAAFIRSEMDSFGPVATFVCCAGCDLKATEREGNETRVCHDCSKTVKVKDSFEWRWYDFYRPQGDIPLCICNTCRALPKHQTRVKNDQADADAEREHLGYRVDADPDFDDDPGPDPFDDDDFDDRPDMPAEIADPVVVAEITTYQQINETRNKRS